MPLFKRGVLPLIKCNISRNDFQLGFNFKKLDKILICYYNIGLILVDKNLDGDDPMKSKGGVLFLQFHLEFDSSYP